jgi:hypothetical protein
MSFFESDRSRWLDGTVPTYHITASATFADHVTGAIARLSIVTAAIFHVEPVTGASTVTKGFGAIDRDVFVLAMKRWVDKGSAVLNEAMVDKATGARESVEGV